MTTRALLLLTTTIACAPPPAPLAPVRIGVLNPLSGSLGTQGPAWEDAARLAAEQVNAAGGAFDGRPVELVVEDTESTPTKARAAAAKLVDEGVHAVVGPASSAEALETLDVLADARIPQTSCCATSSDLTTAQPPVDRWFFRTTPSDALQGRALAHVALNGFTGTLPNALPACAEAIVVHRGDAYGASLAATFRAAYENRGMGVLGTSALLAPPIAYPETATVFDDVATTVDAALAARAADSASPVCVLLVSFPPDGLGVLAAIAPRIEGYASTRAGFVYRYLASDGLYDAAFAAQAGARGPLVVATAPTHAEGDAYREFDEAFRARFDAPPGNLTFTMYDAVVLNALAFAAAGTDDGAAVRDALFDVSRGGQRFEGRFFGEIAEAVLRGADVDYTGPSGPLDFDDHGDVVGDYVVWQPVQDGITYVVGEFGTLPATSFASE